MQITDKQESENHLIEKKSICFAALPEAEVKITRSFEVTV